MDTSSQRLVMLNSGADLQGFREAVRVLLHCSIPPEQISFLVRPRHDLAGDSVPSPIGAAGRPLILPRRAVDLIRLVICHSDHEKYALIYRLLWRMKGPDEPQPGLVGVLTDPLVQRLIDMESAVRRDLEQVRCRVRFREVHDPDLGLRFVGWFEPEHYTVTQASPFLIDRFSSLDWTLLTPRGSIWWDRRTLFLGPPAGGSEALVVEAGRLPWTEHQPSTFNPSVRCLGQAWGQISRSWSGGLAPA